MEDIPSALPDRILNKICQLSSQLHYIILYFPKVPLWQKYACMFTENKNPYLLIFEDQENITNLDLARQLIEENNLKVKPEGFFFQEKKTNWDFRNMKMAFLKRILQAENIDGYQFEVTYNELEYEPECGVVDMTVFDDKIKKKEKKLTFYIQQINYYFTVNQDTKDTFKTFTTKISNQINKDFKIQVDPGLMIISYMDQYMKECIVSFHNFSKLTRKDQIFIKFIKEIKINKPFYKNQDNSIAIKFEQYQKKFAYSQIRALKISTILDNFMQFKQKGLKSIEYGLRIHDLIIKPCESLSDHAILDKLFLSESRYVKIVLGLVIKQQFMFYAHLRNMGDLIGQNEVIFNKLVHKSPSNQGYRNECITLIKQRAKFAKHIEFKNNQKRIEPILYYTSNLLITNQNKQMKLYVAQNLFLRDMQFGTIDRREYNKWQFLFANSLIKNLTLINEYKGQLYRGISHKEKHKLGQIMTYKQFNSCSTDMNQSLKFTETTLYILKNCIVGRKIRDYSYYQTEQEVLNLPYTSYKITDIGKMKHKGQYIQLVTMEEHARPPLAFDLKDQKQLFVLWVDGEKGQGVTVSKNITQIRQTTFFIHMKTTKELDEWLNENKDKLKIPTISLVLITNMFRLQNKVPTQNAGALAIKTFNRYRPEGKTLVYIGNLQNAKAKLMENKISIGNQVKITDNEYGLMKFFYEQCGIS